MTNKVIYGSAPFQSSIDNKFHYVYRITNLVEGKHYYGVRSSKVSPFDDLGSKYYASPKAVSNKWIIKDQKFNPSNYKYKILRCFNSRENAMSFECEIHSKFNVRKHDKFYNASNQTSTGFDGPEVSYFKDHYPVINKITGQKEIICRKDFDQNIHAGITVGKVIVKLKLKSSGEFQAVDKAEFIKNKELYEHNIKGRVRVLVISTEESKTVTKEEFYTNRHLYLSPKQIPKWRKLRDSNSWSHC